MPLSIGFLSGFTGALFNSATHRRINFSGVAFSLSIVSRLIPGCIVGSILSAILISLTGSGIDTSYYTFTKEELGRSNLGQGGFQMIGFLLSVVFGIAGAFITGVVMQCVSFSKAEDQFNDEAIFVSSNPIF